MTWREGYLRQAISDFDVYQLLKKEKVPLCHRLHFLQMASEKLAKSFLCGQRKPYKKTHYVLVRFLISTKRNPSLQRLLEYGDNPNAYRAYIDDLLDIAQRIESLAPVEGNQDKINPEYPWEDTNGMVQVPRDYAFSEFEPTDLVKVQSLLVALIRIAPGFISLNREPVEIT